MITAYIAIISFRTIVSVSIEKEKATALESKLKGSLYETLFYDFDKAKDHVISHAQRDLAALREKAFTIEQDIVRIRFMDKPEN